MTTAAQISIASPNDGPGLGLVGDLARLVYGDVGGAWYTGIVLIGLALTVVGIGGWVELVGAAVVMTGLKTISGLIA